MRPSLSATNPDSAGSWRPRSLGLAIGRYFAAHLARDRQVHEMDRAIQRAVTCALMCLAVTALVAGWKTVLDPRFAPLIWFTISYGLLSIWYYYRVRANPQACIPLQYAFFLLDPFLAVWLISRDPAGFAWFSVVLLAFITRTGVRYGMRTMMLSWVAAMVFLPLFFLFSNPTSWLANREASYVILASLFVAVPLFIPVIRQLARSHDLDVRAIKIDALTQQLEARTDYLARVSHELKTPLQAIVATLDLIELRSGSKPDPSLVGVVRRAADSLSTHLTDFLTLAKGEGGTLTVSPKKVDVLELFYSLAGNARRLAKSKGLELYLEAPDSWPAAFIDGVRVTQVGENLLGNALKYTEAGSITVTLMPYVPAGGNLIFSVSDTGCGIHPEDIPSIFTSYVRGASTASRIEGSGIGLSVVQILVAYLGGSVEVQSQLGVGSVFTVMVPVVLASPHEGSTAPSARALLVDHDPITAGELLAVIAEAQLTCDFAPSVGQALNHLAAYRYDYIFVTPSMPTRSGVHLALEIHHGGNQNSEALLVAVGDSDEERRSHAVWPFAATLPRPFNLRTLRGVLASRTRPPAPTGSPTSLPASRSS